MDFKKLNTLPLSDAEFIEYLDYAMDLLDEFEAQIDIFCAKLREKRVPVLAV